MGEFAMDTNSGTKRRTHLHTIRTYVRITLYTFFYKPLDLPAVGVL